MNRRILGFIGVMVVAAGLWMLALPSASAPQPVAFNHAKHTVSCAVCHQGVDTTAHAGIPDRTVCEKCHATAPPHVSEAAWRDLGGATGWVRVTQVPSHVVFSHRRHVALGRLECASCHADIGRRTAPPSAAPMALTMNNCIACHRREGASEDCAGCHR